ncbi:MAG TPA: nucleotide exchange factor GrpE [Gammaproteobacteria bacterium]|nr:nucleotide exchange factor GrpE [Gammaproteobacteria bacterium]
MSSESHPETKGPEQEVPHLPVESREALEAALNKAEQKMQENWELALRARAELENVQRRAQREIEQAQKHALEKFIRELIPIVDSLQQGLDNAPSGDPMREGIVLTLKMFTDLFNKFSITLIDPKGEPFDPTYHEAIAMQEDATVAAGSVLIVMQKGYQLHGRLIRPARVVVAKTAE